MNRPVGSSRREGENGKTRLPKSEGKAYTFFLPAAPRGILGARTESDGGKWLFFETYTGRKVHPPMVWGAGGIWGRRRAKPSPLACPPKTEMNFPLLGLLLPATMRPPKSGREGLAKRRRQSRHLFVFWLALSPGVQPFNTSSRRNGVHPLKTKLKNHTHSRYGFFN